MCIPNEFHHRSNLQSVEKKEAKQTHLRLRCVGCFFLSLLSPLHTSLHSLVRMSKCVLKSSNQMRVQRSLDQRRILVCCWSINNDTTTERRKLIVFCSLVSFDVIFVDLTFHTVRRDYSARPTRLRMDLIYTFSFLDRRMRIEVSVSLNDHITCIESEIEDVHRYFEQDWHVERWVAFIGWQRRGEHMFIESPPALGWNFIC